MSAAEDAKTRNVEMHAEGGYYLEEVGSNSSFVNWGQEVAAGVALAEIQDGEGRPLVNAAGEATEALLKRGKEAKLKASLEMLNLCSTSLPTVKELERAFQKAAEVEQQKEAYERLKGAFIFVHETLTHEVVNMAGEAEVDPAIWIHLAKLGWSSKYLPTEETLGEFYVAARKRSLDKLSEAFHEVRRTIKKQKTASSS